MLIISLIAAAAATSTPTYLHCAYPDGSQANITADEARSKVVFAGLVTDAIFELPAIFTPDAVRFNMPSVSFSISRTDLSIERRITGTDSVERGTCKVLPPPARAF